MVTLDKYHFLYYTNLLFVTYILLYTFVGSLPSWTVPFVFTFIILCSTFYVYFYILASNTGGDEKNSYGQAGNII